MCSVARATVEPPTNTGSSSATGVSTPVRPTCTAMPSTRVETRSGSYLKATAQRGALAVEPSRRRRSMRSIFTTTPSVSKSSSRRFSRHSSMNAATASSPAQRRQASCTGKPQRANASRLSACVPNSAPSAT